MPGMEPLLLRCPEARSETNGEGKRTRATAINAATRLKPNTTLRLKLKLGMR